MGYVLNEDQTILKEAAKGFIQEKAPVAALRKLRDDKDESGFSQELWAGMVEMGWAGIAIPEDNGGLGFGFQGLGIVLEEAGRTLTASPLVSTVLVGATAIQLGGSDEQKSSILPAVASGELTLALALEEMAQFRPYTIASMAEETEDGFRLNGEKSFVLDGHVADKLIVAARSKGGDHDREGISLFLVDRNADGMTAKRTAMVDNRNASTLELVNVNVSKDALIGELGNGADIIDPLLDHAAIGLAAEMLGTAQECFDRTLEYLKERTQFDAKIGSFQALQHRAVDMYCELELSKSIVMDALSALDDEARKDEIPELASMAKAQVSDTLHLVSSEGVQMHGGIGMTDEHEIGFFLKRARAAERTFGDASWHYKRLATLGGY